jgi:superfamily II DNA or RNA helicase
MNNYYKKVNKSTNKKAEIAISVVFPKACKTYLGQKGYTILKDELTQEQLSLLKEKLIARPMVMGSIGNGPPKVFSIYRESTKKIYVPRYFGEEFFGKVSEVTLPDGDSIDVPFLGSLRDIQKPAVKAYMDYVSTANHASGLLELPCAFGKTVLSLNIISQLKVKTLIIVNKEFLLNQWIERINQFLPTARIGKIQGQIIDIDNKDIVIGMLQSLSMKDYDANIFSSFGLTILDEVHHISSEVFSNSLFKIVTKYMLGLSATMERKDGTTDIIKMFLGEVVYKGINNEEHDVLVRGIEYKTKDVEFNDVELDYKGNPQYSKMIVKLCNFFPRSDFIVNVLNDLIDENPENQIMILGHNRSILYYLHDKIKEKNFATVGYYLGGMKQCLLDETCKKQIICASFSMASEALDISTLSSLVFVTPKTDIVQAVGRILRTKHNNPIIVDIIDKHQLFQNQWKKRKVFYKKCNYDIRTTDNIKYNNMLDTDNKVIWKMINQPNSNNNCKKNLKNIIDEDDEIVGKCLINLDEL